MNDGSTLVLLPGFDGTGELFGPLQAALGNNVVSNAVRYDAERSFEDYVNSVARILPHENAVLVAHLLLQSRPAQCAAAIARFLADEEDRRLG